MRFRSSVSLVLPVILASLGVVASAAPAHASVYRTIDLESASISGNYLYDNGWSFRLANQNSPDARKPVISTDRAHTGTRSLKFIVDPDTDGVKERTEAHVSEGISIAHVRYTSFWIFVRNDFQAFAPGSNSRELFMQVWQGVDGPNGWSGYPPFALYFKPGSNLQYEVVIKKDGEEHAPSQNQIKYTDTLPKGQWVNFVVGWKADPIGTNGYIRIWRDGVEKYAYNGRWAYSPAVTTSTTFLYRHGLYGNPAQSITVPQVVYFDDITYGNSYSSVTSGS